MRVLVTGGAGFVGANLVSYLIDHGHEVRILDDLSAGSRPEWWGNRSKRPQVVEGHVEDAASARRATRGMDAVVHLAAKPGVADSVAHPEQDFRSNVLGTFTVLDGARRAGVRTFVFASSGAVLAGATPPLREDMAPAPQSPYGASKLYGEGLVAASDVFGITGVSLRFANVYGPLSAHKGSVIAQFLKRVLAGRPLLIYGTGRQTRDFLFVEDVCTAVERALGAKRKGVYHLGTGVETSVNELVRAVQKVSGTKGQVDRQPARPADAARSFVDLSAARRALKWSPRVDLEEGLRRTLEWMRSSAGRGP
jgi:UDP-glucose 4-epimerase